MAKTLKTSTSSQAVSRAKTSQSLEKVKALKDRGRVFGQKCVASLAKYDPDTQLLKTYQCSFIEDLNVYSATLPKSGTIVNGKLSEQTMLVLGIEGRESGLWPTPTGTERSGTNPKTGRGEGLSKVVKMTLKDTHSIPTPTASDHIKRESTSTEKLNFATNKTVSLDRWVEKFPDQKTTDKMRQQMFPTPNTMDHLPPMDKEKRLNHPSRPGRKVSGNLREEVIYRRFPTPSESEDAAGTPKGKMQRMLGDCEEVRNTGTGTLNPTWVEWLMGFPIGWTDLKDSETP
jgi:hypothetical protein